MKQADEHDIFEISMAVGNKVLGNMLVNYFWKWATQHFAMLLWELYVCEQWQEF